MSTFDADSYSYWRLRVGPCWIRAEPAATAECVGYGKEGEEIAVRGIEGNWVERVEGGWMMVDGAAKGLGLLLDRLWGAEAVGPRLAQRRREVLRAALGPKEQARYRAEDEIAAALRRPPDSDDSDGDGDAGDDAWGGFTPGAWARRPIVFVGGLHRSGTTAFTKLLSASPIVASFHDTDAPEDEGQHLQDAVPTDEMHGGVGAFAFDPTFHWTEATEKPDPRGVAPSRLLAAWDAHWRAKIKKTRPPVLLEKSPANLVHLRWLREAFGQRAKFVVMVRHPLAVAFATRFFTQTRIRRHLVDSEPTDDPPPTLREVLEHWVAAMRLFDDDDAALGFPAVRVDFTDFIKDPKEAVARVEAGCLGGARLNVPLSAFCEVDGIDPDAKYAREWAKWPIEDHEAVIKGRVADNIRANADDEDLPEGVTRLKEADFTEIDWLQDEIGAATIAAEFADDFARFGFNVWSHPGLPDATTAF